MMTVINYALLTVSQAIVIFKFFPAPKNVVIFFASVLIEVFILGYFYSPHRSETLKAEFEKIGSKYDAVMAAQREVQAVLGDYSAIPGKLAQYNSAVADFQQLIPDPGSELKDAPTRIWYTSCLTSFRLFGEVAKQYLDAGPNQEIAGGQELVAKMQAADKKVKSILNLVGLRYKALEKSFPYAIATGFLTWLQLALQNSESNSESSSEKT